MRSLLLLVCCFALSDPTTTVADVANDETVRALFSDLVRLGGQGRWNTERAAFLVREASGYRCILWPATRGFEREQYRGRMPAGTVAIVHTHPRSQPRPSVGDLETAQRIDLPVLAVTPMSIFAATPGGEVIRLVDGRRWATAPPEEHRCR